MIRTVGIQYSYGATPALVDVNLEVKRGEFVGIVGPNGSGKTTLLRLLAGLLRPTVGTVFLEGKDLDVIPRSRRARRVALVPQSTDISFEFTVGEIVLLGRTPHLWGMGFEREKDIRIAKDAMEAVDVLPLASRPITAISGGERQRVILARALAQATPILLLDEPVSHLDLRHQADVYNLLRKRKEEKETTIVLVSHDLNLPARFCDRIVALKDGQVAAEGTPREVITEENIHRIFGARMKVMDDGAPVVVPTPEGDG